MLPPHGPTVPAFTFSDRRPRLVVLMHGVTPKPTEDANVATARHSRAYWGYQFIQGVMGVVGQPNARVVTPKFTGELHVKTHFGKDWNPINYPPFVKGELAPIVMPQHPSFMDDGLFQKIENNTKEIRTVIKFMHKAKVDPVTSVMVTYRDGSKHLMPQTGEAIDQIYATYVLAYGHLAEKDQPQIYLVGHSFGGVVARAILANPEGADLFGNKLTAEQRWRADFLRSRVVHVTSIAVPHHGTPMGVTAQEFAKVVKAIGNATTSMVKSSKVLDKLDVKEDVLKTVNEATKTALAGISGTRDCLDDLTRMNEYNAGILKPQTAVRGPGKTELVPIYTMAGRTPGGMTYGFDRAPPFIGLEGAIDRPYDLIDLIKGPKRDFGGETTIDIKRAHEAIALNAIQGAMHVYGFGKASGHVWGRATVPESDYVKSPWTGVFIDPLRKPGQPMILDGFRLGTVMLGLFKGDVYERGSDGDTDSDGFLGWDSAHALGINSPNYYRLFDRQKYGTWMPWDIDNHGSLMFNVGVGAYIHNEMLRKAGPNVVPGSRLSLYPGQAPVQNEKHDVKIELLEVTDAENKLDPATDADFQVTVRIAEKFHKTKEISGVTVKTFGNATHSNVPSSVIPIHIQVNEIDDGADPDDNVVITGRWGREDLWLYFDTRTGQVLGDETVPASSTFKAIAPVGLENRGSIKLRITGK